MAKPDPIWLGGIFAPDRRSAPTRQSAYKKNPRPGPMDEGDVAATLGPAGRRLACRDRYGSLETRRPRGEGHRWAALRQDTVGTRSLRRDVDQPHPAGPDGGRPVLPGDPLRSLPRRRIPHRTCPLQDDDLPVRA